MSSDGRLLATDYKREVEEAATLKQEIVSIRHPGVGTEEDDALATASGLLDATEKAADNILRCAEKIDELAGSIKSETKSEQITAHADELSEQVVNIFEA